MTLSQDKRLQRGAFYLTPLNWIRTVKSRVANEMMRRGVVGALALGVLGMAEGAIAQNITPDSTVGTQVNNATLTQTSPFPAPNGFVVTGGTIKGTNLFHSFETFSPDFIPTEFNLTGADYQSINNIFSRVTGTAPSSLNGYLQVVGGSNPNLFLLNPNGVLIGSGSSMNIPGSLFLTTADSIRFKGGTHFSASETSSNPLLTVSAPVGLQFGATANSIDVAGRLTEQDPQTRRYNPSEFFRFRPNASVTLLGGDVRLERAYLQSPGGQLQLGSVAENTFVALNSQNHTLTYAADTPFRNIDLERSALDVSGLQGAVNIQGRALQLRGSGVIANTLGAQLGGGIDIRVSEQINVDGSTISSAVFPMQTGPTTFVPSTGKGGDIRIIADQLNVTNQSIISTDTFSEGNGGDLTIHVKDFRLTNLEPLNSGSNDFPVTVTASTLGEGRGGNLMITADNFFGEGYVTVVASTLKDNFGTSESSGLNPDLGSGGSLTVNVDSLTLREGAQFGTGTFGSGNGGSLTVDAKERIEISGFQSVELESGLTSRFSSGIFVSAQIGSTGNGGNLRVTTPQLIIREGGKLGGETSGAGNAGNIQIVANDIAVSDPVLNIGSAVSGIIAEVSSTGSGEGGQLDIVSDRIRVFNGGQIAASTDGAGNAGNINIDADVVEVEGFSGDEIGLGDVESDGFIASAIASRSTTGFNAGSVTITAEQVELRDRGTISVSSTAGGAAGDVNITAGAIKLDNGSIQAEANAGDRGNLNINSRDTLLLRNGSRLSANATETATGGNVAISAPLIIGTGNSDISANAIEGDGGNIRLVTQGLVGLAFRDQPTSGSDITASSELGVSGTVDIESPDTETDSGLVQLPENLEDASDQVVASCAAQEGNQFASTGRGGLPTNPLASISSNRPWQDFSGLDRLIETGDLAADNAEAARQTALTRRSAPPQNTSSQEIVLQEAGEWKISATGDVELLATHRVNRNADDCLESSIASAS